jgi:acyl-CoA synthetase (AMP-forming)/AMP-acid ligase II
VVLGRIDDMIVTGGENVAPQAVEAVLTSLDGVAAAVVYGITDPEWGEIVAAAVVPAADTAVTVAQLEAHARSHLPPSHRPRRWRIVEDLPLQPNGKIDRRAVAGPAS